MLGPLGQSRIISLLSTELLITPAKCLLPCDIFISSKDQGVDGGLWVEGIVCTKVPRPSEAWCIRGTEGQQMDETGKSGMEEAKEKRRADCTGEDWKVMSRTLLGS